MQYKNPKAIAAFEAGLESLALQLCQKPQEANDITDKTTLEGVRFILVEQMSQTPKLIDALGHYCFEKASLSSEKLKRKHLRFENIFEPFFSYKESLPNIRTRDLMTLLRGRHEHILKVALLSPKDIDPILSIIIKEAGIICDDILAPQHTWLKETLQFAWRSTLWPKLEKYLFEKLRRLAENKALELFLIKIPTLFPVYPVGKKSVIALEPSLHEGITCLRAVVVDEKGHVLDCTTLYPHFPLNAWSASQSEIVRLMIRHHAHHIAFSNQSRGFRNTKRLIKEIIQRYPDLHIKYHVINDSGALSYATSPAAVEELSAIDTAFRSTVSIARRLQTPQDELKKMDPVTFLSYPNEISAARVRPAYEKALNEISENSTSKPKTHANHSNYAPRAHHPKQAKPPKAPQNSAMADALSQLFSK